MSQGLNEWFNYNYWTQAVHEGQGQMQVSFRQVFKPIFGRCHFFGWPVSMASIRSMFLSILCVYCGCFASSSTAKRPFFIGKISSATPPWGTWWRTHYGGMEKKEKAPQPAGIEPTTSRVLLFRRVLYRCATTAAKSIRFIGSVEDFQDSLTCQSDKWASRWSQETSATRFETQRRRSSLQLWLFCPCPMLG